MPGMQKRFSADLIILGATPGGICTALAAAREGRSSLIIERSDVPGGLPANGLGATDIGTRGGTGGFFLRFVREIRAFYEETYGADSDQVRDCSDGYHFEPSVAEQVFRRWLEAASGSVRVIYGWQMDPDPDSVVREGDRIKAIHLVTRDRTGTALAEGAVFIDATYEGDLVGASGCPFAIGREGRAQTGEPMAGRIYKAWLTPPAPGSTGLGDNAIQAYNYRLCLTRDPKKRILPECPKDYRREEYLSLIDDIQSGFWAGKTENELHLDGIGRLTNMVILPNGKTDANNQHLAMISTDLPEENWPWPMAGWEWRDRFAERLRNYITGLLWFSQNDPEVPGEFRERCREWGFAADEYTDNGNFPRMVYVREGRRLRGRKIFQAQDATPVAEGKRPPLHAHSVTASHYALDSHAVLKREPGRDSLEGIFSFRTRPYTVPAEVMIPEGRMNLLVPVAASSTHIGFSTLRMEPCWMALGEAAGHLAAHLLSNGDHPEGTAIFKIQKKLLEQGAVLLWFENRDMSRPENRPVQLFALHGFLGEEVPWQIELNEPLDDARASAWRRHFEKLTGNPAPGLQGLSMEAALQAMWDAS